MAIQMDTPHPCGLVFRGAYWRFNNFEQAPNRQADQQYSVPFVARFRPFKSKADFEAGRASLDLGTGLLDMLVSFTPSSISANLADEAYAAFLAYDPTLTTLYALEAAKDRRAEQQDDIAAAQARIDTDPNDSEAKADLDRLTTAMPALDDAIMRLQAEHDEASALRARIEAATNV